ncbi:cytoplasmic dynein 2 intermediate chain 2 [Patella vulgata]|uniref:cytoplasmic dynein 2 intermediate chain 2 n=1 Tax=Patella vulgata TaxID=6465 RepID=UPI002180483C|nr:cytoplasmic dynein 2 intermediate chain 2 [Patella vulgata]
MFTDEDLEPVEFQSCWKKERYTDEVGVQTKDLDVEDAGVQSKNYEDEGTQTDNSRGNYFQLAETDEGRLEKFLKKVEPRLCKILERNLKSVAFDDYVIRTYEDDLAVTCTHTLCHDELKDELQITGVSWNSTGSVLAATYGRFDHEDWCTHKAALCTWSLDRRDINPNKPNVVIDSPSCIMCLEFHPTNPAWVVGGNFSGEVLVWDLNKEDDLLISTSGIGDDAHREPVAKVQWILDPNSKGRSYNIISVGGDGKVLIWTMSKKKPKLKLVEGFVLMTQSLPRNMKVRGVRGDKEIGATCISFNSEDKDTFIVGSESGCIFKCNLHAQGNPAGSHIVSSVPLRSPVTFTFNPHHGPVHSVDYSPFHRNAFLTSGMDQCIRIYNVLQDQPTITVEPGEGYLYSAKWSPVRPTLLAAATEKGNLLLYDLKSDQLVPIHKIEASVDNKPVYTLQFNLTRRNLLATGDGSGYIRVFKLGDDLSSLAPRDVEHLSHVINTTD